MYDLEAIIGTKSWTTFFKHKLHNKRNTKTTHLVSVTFVGQYANR